ncbi:GTA-gp10 family protein [Jannaschia sp. LMIT008]|uniref:GTA-gp10 family protein n=1 Tax=Jannaschia maritima TaxID=3032585 RepID=UPI0028123338|nr:GTA-gp10 family protein [Jannaschia sp. LMIT008]
MANPWEGEVELTIDGKARRMRLTLRALAELERSLDVDDVDALLAILDGNRLGARELVALAVAGLRGGGWAVDAGMLLDADIAGGPAALIAAVARMVETGFRLPDGAAR